MNEPVITYLHHGLKVKVMEKNKGTHRANCLCHNGCLRFREGSGVENCKIARDLFRFDIDHGTVTPVYECPLYVTEDVINKTLPSPHLYDYVDEVAAMLKDKLVEDEKRYGLEWILRGRNGQLSRFMTWVRTKAQFTAEKGEKFPWESLLGEALIGYVREKYLENDETPKSAQ